MKKIGVYEFALTLLFAIGAAFGISDTMKNKVLKNSGEITMENYKSYLSFSVEAGKGGGDAEKVTYDFSVTVASISFYEITDLSATYSLKAAHASFSSSGYKKTLSRIESKSSALLDEGTVDFYFSANDISEWIQADSQIFFSLISVSGNYAYSLK